MELCDTQPSRRKCWGQEWVKPAFYLKFAIAMRKGVRPWEAFLHLAVSSAISGHLTRSLVLPFQAEAWTSNILFHIMQEYVLSDGANKEHKRQKDKEDKS